MLARVKRRNGLIARGDINGNVNGNESSIIHIYTLDREALFLLLSRKTRSKDGKSKKIKRFSKPKKQSFTFREKLLLSVRRAPSIKNSAFANSDSYLLYNEKFSYS